MSWVRLHNCVQNTKGLVPLTAEVYPIIGNIRQDVISLEQFIAEQPEFANSIEWILELDGFKLWAGECLANLDLTEWIKQGGEDRLFDVILAVVTQWGYWAYAKTITEVETKLGREITTHPRIISVLECSNRQHNFCAQPHIQ